jgi:transcriptional regulator with XRE-family HTH domain
MKARKPLTIERAFGLVVQARRARLKVSQEELGYRSGLHRTFVSQIERGLKSPSLRTLFAIARALDTEAETLVREAKRLARHP